MKPDIKQSCTDETLILEYLNGDNNALGVLYQRYYQKVYYKCLSFSKNPEDAFDLSQEVLMRAFSKVSGFKGESKFSTWLFTITANYCISHMVKDSKTIPDSKVSNYKLYEEGFDDSDMEERIDYEEREEKLKKILDEIPENDKKMLELKYRENYSVKQLQEFFNLSASAVKMRLMRARQKVELFYTI